MSDKKISNHYDQTYFKWQAVAGEFGGWASLSKFSNFISKNDTVLDFGCGGGFLLKKIDCKKKIGVEINPRAIEIAQINGIEVYKNTEDISDESIDVIISDNALEHTLRPFDELQSLYKKLKKGGKIIFVVPCESISLSYIPKNINHHLYSWSPVAIGNLFTEVGFSLIESKAYIHKWFPKSKIIAKIFGRTLFEIGCRIYGRLERSWFQVRIIAQK